MNFTTIGYLAGFFTTAAFVPQVMHAYRRRSCTDLSWTWLAIFAIGLGLWLTYGLLLNNWPMILANAITLTLCASLAIMKIRYGNAAEGR